MSKYIDAGKYKIESVNSCIINPLTVYIRIKNSHLIQKTYLDSVTAKLIRSLANYCIKENKFMDLSSWRIIDD